MSSTPSSTPALQTRGDPLPTGSLLMEAMRRVDEIDHLRDALPAATPVAALAGVPRDAVETTVLGYLGPGPLPVNDLVARGVAEGAADEHDVLAALARLRERGVVTPAFLRRAPPRKRRRRFAKGRVGRGAAGNIST